MACKHIQLMLFRFQLCNGFMMQMWSCGRTNASVQFVYGHFLYFTGLE